MTTKETVPGASTARVKADRARIDRLKEHGAANIRFAW